MPQSKTFARIIFIVLFFALFVTACGPSNSIYGRWKDTTGGTLFEFTLDGKMRREIQGGTLIYDVEYSQPGTLVVKADLLQSGKPDTSLTYKVDGDKLDLTIDPTSPQGTLNLVRVK